eukprot:GHRQ01038690.1.p1 GENE.GHRQ01038690.1~~GHRQ01038690.1.p1  ORF type:complete len:256 (+),score=98.84 GHRQ01038690.1:290-1057(+)
MMLLARRRLACYCCSLPRTHLASGTTPLCNVAHLNHVTVTKCCRFSAPVCRSLLADVGARLWRVRQAACASLTDLLTGRRWPQLAPHMEQLWVMGLRAADDVKESVRGAAGSLVRSLRGISLRIMDAQQSPAADVAGCCSVVLPLLAGCRGLGSSVPDIRGVAADVLCSGIKTAGSAQVLPVLPAVVPVLLEALSGMEDARLNYVEQVGRPSAVAACRDGARRHQCVGVQLNAPAVPSNADLAHNMCTMLCFVLH